MQWEFGVSSMVGRMGERQVFASACVDQGDREGRPYHTTLRFRGGHSYRVGATLAVALVALRQTERKLYDGGKLHDFPE